MVNKDEYNRLTNRAQMHDFAGKGVLNVLDGILLK